MPDDQSSIPTKPVPLPSEQPDRAAESVGASGPGIPHEPSPPAESAGLNPGALFAHALTTVKGPASGGARSWVPPTIEELRRALPQYEISEMLGRGGMGAVYKGVQRSLDRVVAIKILPSGIEEGDVHYSERFKMEAKSMARLSHPGIVAVFDAGETADGLLYFVMEFVEGTDVQKMIAQGPLPPEHALAITAHVCDALGFAHESGIVHRDIKPANIMVDARGHVKVADFGLAKVTTQDSGGFTGTNFSMGTPNYIAPESITSVAHVDGRADLYAVGVMLYAMLTGEIPRGRFALASTKVPGLDPRFDAIVDKAMQADREHRYASAAALRTDLDSILSGPIPTALPVVAKRSKAPLLIAAAAVVLAVGGWFAWKNAWWNARSERVGAGGADASPNALGARVPPSIKLWDTPEKIPTSTKQRWEKNAVRLDGQPLRENVRVRDLILRATVLLNPDAKTPHIQARVQTTAKGDLTNRQYYLGVAADFRFLVLGAVIEGKRTDLRSWPMPRPPGPDQWLPLELRIVGDEITVSADGKVLGTVHDSSVPDAGAVVILATAAGYFRDIEYAPLDKAESTAASEPGAIKLWDTPDKLPKKPGFRWENGAVILDSAALKYSAPLSRDAILRAEIRMNPDAKGMQLVLRELGTLSGGDSHFYRLMVGYESGAVNVVLFVVHLGKTTALHSWKLPRAYGPDEWLRLELRAIGDELTATADGQTLGTVHDTSLPDAGSVQLFAVANGQFRNIVYVPLDKPGPASTAADNRIAALAANPANWVDRLNTRKWEAPWLLESGVLKTTNKDQALSGSLTSMRDGAIRVHARATGSTGIQLQLILRSGPVFGKQNATGLYQFQTNVNGLACALFYYEKLNGVQQPNETLWKSVPLPAALAGQTEMDWELRAVGDELSAWANGQFVASAHDKRVLTGGASITSDVGLEITRVETIDFANVSPSPSLPASADAALRVASGELSRSPRLPVSASSRAATYPKPAEWIDATSEVGVKMGVIKAGVLEDGQLRMTKGASIPVTGGREFHNAIVRLTCTHNATLFLRRRDAARYNATARSNGGGSIEFNDPAQDANTYVKRELGIPPANFDPEAEHEVVFAVQDDRFTLWVDGVEKTTLRDSTLATGAIGVQINTADGLSGNVRIRKIEYAELPDTVPAK